MTHRKGIAVDVKNVADMSPEQRDCALCDLLNSELICALGCTEPIAVAYAAALARLVLGCEPESLEVGCSGNIVKNVKSVTVPNSGGMRGVEAAAVLGAVGGDASAALEALEGVGEADIARTRDLLAQEGYCEVTLIEGVPNLYIEIKARALGHVAEVAISEHHTNVVRCMRDGVPANQLCPAARGGDVEDSCSGTCALMSAVQSAGDSEAPAAKPLEGLTLDIILDFVEGGDISGARESLERQLTLNTAISEEGLVNEWGAEVGRTLLATRGDDVSCRARARAAAGSDARMNGCEQPVVINSGSGNQGITTSVPVIVYARELGVSDEKLLRALTLSNLTTIHEKTPIGRLSAYCGAISAGAGAGAGIAYLCGGDYDAVIHTVVNALAVVSGVICDGAKASCAAKIATAVEAGLLGYNMYIRGNQFRAGDGIVAKGVENSLKNVGRLGKQGMKETNNEIIAIMVGC